MRGLLWMLMGKCHAPYGGTLWLCGALFFALGVGFPNEGRALDNVSHATDLQSPRAAKAFQVFKRHCVHCHSGAGSGQRREGGWSFSILDFEKLVSEPGLVRAGNPDGSSLYNVMVSRRMPPPKGGVASGSVRSGLTVPGPTAREIEAVRDWIGELKELKHACLDRSRAQLSELVVEVEAYVRGLAPNVARTTRFLSLAHMAGNCVREKELQAYRSGLAGLLNGLSWRSGIVALKPVGQSGLILAVDLEDLGWPARFWSWLGERAGSSTRLSAELKASTRGVLGSRTPVVRADWFSKLARSPQAYYKFLEVPETVDGLRRKLRSVYGRAGGITVGGVRKSRFTFLPRLMARHQFGSDGFMWEAIDAPSTEGGSTEGGRVDGLKWLQNPQAIFSSLYGVGASSQRRVQSPFRMGKDIVRRFIYRLPNGHMGLMLADGLGKRIDGTDGDYIDLHAGRRLDLARGRIGHSEVSRYVGSDTGSKALRRRADFNCLGCHVRGPERFSNDVGALTVSGGDNDNALAFDISYWGRQDLAVTVSNDQFAYAKALRHSSGQTVWERDGFDPVGSLVERYLGALDLGRAAAELWLEPSQLLSILEGYEGSHVGIARRLRQGTVTREEFHTLNDALGLSGEKVTRSYVGRYVSAPAPVGGAANGSGLKREPARGFWRLSLWTDKLRYKVGDEGIVYVSSAQDCRVTLISVDGDGVASVLFPNGFSQDNLIRRGETLSIPAKSADFRLRFKKAGTEQIIGMCALPSVDQLPGIDHDFKLNAFTVLGNWRNHISDTIKMERDAFSRGTVSRSSRRGSRGRRRGRRRSNRRQPRWLTEQRQPFLRAREAISISVSW